ncbi:MAG: TIM barrel protein [Planctomycetota bacterium]|jgi:sugar phosphate isomerase/epimerase
MDVKYGACEWALPGNGIDSIRISKEVGLDGLQLGFVSYERGFLLSQKRFRDFYMEEADKYEIEIPSMAICEFDNYGLKNAKTTEKGKIVYEIIDLAIEAAADMSMKMIMMPSFVDGFIDTDEELAITAEALQYACKSAAENNIIIASENLLTVERNTLLFEQVGEKNLKGFYDSQNYKSNLGWEQVPMLEKLYDILYPEIHVKDGIGDKGSSRLLGEGDTDFYGTMNFLKTNNYSGWIHLENFYDRLPLRTKSPKNYIDILKMDLDILKSACE